MSVLGGPFIGDIGDDLICAFHPDIPLSFGDGAALGQQVVDTQSFNKTNVRKYVSSPPTGNTGFWGNPARSIDPVLISKGLSNQESGVYTSFSNQKIYNPNILRYAYTFNPPITNYLLTNNGLTICGFFKVNAFPSINNKQKQRLGIFSMNYGGHYDTSETLDRLVNSGIGIHRIGVRKADNTLKFSIGVQTNIHSNMAFSMMSDYVYDINKWYFFSYNIRFVEQGRNEDFFQCSLSVDNQPVSTYFCRGVNFFYHKTKQTGKRFLVLNNEFPVNYGFLNQSGNVVPTGVQSGPPSADGETSVSSISTSHNIYPAWYFGTNEYNSDSNIIRTKTDSEMRVYFLQIPKFHYQGGYHDEISVGSHFVFKDNVSLDNLYETYKPLYL